MTNVKMSYYIVKSTSMMHELVIFFSMHHVKRLRFFNLIILRMFCFASLVHRN